MAWLVAVGLLAGCAGGGTPGQVLVSAAVSLTDAFAEIEAAFEAEHEGVDVVLNFGGSSTLREQVIEGAPVDVFASANPSNMDQVVAAGLAADPVVFARNLPVIAVPIGNPGGVSGLEDFAREELLIGLCAEGVPCGDFARQVLADAGVVAAIDTDEPDVRALLTKISLGELDAGIVYATDVAAGETQAIEIPEEVNVVAAYPIAVLEAAPNRDAAERFVEFVLSEAGQSILRSHGFAAP